MPDASASKIWIVPLFGGFAAALVQVTRLWIDWFTWYAMAVGNPPLEPIRVELPDRIEIVEHESECFHSESLPTEWLRHGDCYRCGNRELSAAQVRTIIDTLATAQVDVLEILESGAHRSSGRFSYFVRCTAADGACLLAAWSVGDVPGLLPWHVEVARHRWNSCDPAVPTALLALVDPQGRAVLRRR